MGFGEETDELQDARLIAEHFGTDHHELIIDSSQGMKLYPRMIWHMEVPKYNLYPWFVCELVRKHVTVCLSGNGGDEVFGGYVTRYQHALRIQELTCKSLSFTR
jgi:asparagine synthase (glutamine-hydrolysing)